MILVAGGTGTLGTILVRALRDHDLQVRVLTRDRERAGHLGADLEIAEGDVGQPAAVRGAVRGAQTVVSAVHGFAGTDGAGPATVDRDGNRNLIQAAQAAGVRQFVLVSVKDAAPDHPMELMRMKFASEQQLRETGLEWTIIRPAAYLETWCEVLGRPLVEKGKTMIFGRGQNPINWVSARDVAEFVRLAVIEPALRGQVVDVGGPENLTMRQFVDVFRDRTGRGGRVGRIPRPVMRASSVAMKLVNPMVARQIQAGLVMDTTAMAFDADLVRRAYPSIPYTSLADVVRHSGFAAPARSG